MGRQIHFHMLPEDRDAFLNFVGERDPVIVTARDSDSAEVKPADEADLGSGNALCLWNRKLLPHLDREWVPNPGYYRADEFKMPILEFTCSFAADWEGKPGLGQGRLYGTFENKPQNFKKWYESLVRWIRKSYRKNPKGIDGYVGPAAYEFYKSGGYLLPNFLPPKTQEWVAEIGKQHTREKVARGK